MNIDYEIKKILISNSKPVSDFLLIKEYAAENNLIENQILEFVQNYASDDYPIQYIVGYEYFFDKKIFVSKDVLIPRMETEEVVLCLVENVKKKYSKNQKIKILDLCTGPGTITIGLNKFLSNYNIEYFASDISNKALQFAKKNFDYHNIDVKLFESDLFEKFIETKEKFDIIISNPPYIDIDDVFDKNVFEHEPHIALFAEQKGMEIYNRIFDNIELVVKEEYILCMEIGYNQHENITKNANNVHTFNKFDIIYDINGLSRIFIAFGGKSDS